MDSSRSRPRWAADRGCRQDEGSSDGPDPGSGQFTKALETHLTKVGKGAPLRLRARAHGLNKHLGVLDVATLPQGALVAACQRRPLEV
jgi:hypothetical protein